MDRAQRGQIAVQLGPTGDSGRAEFRRKPLFHLGHLMLRLMTGPLHRIDILSGSFGSG